MATRFMISWALLTGEYPPALGGVADYTRLVARGLAAAGDHVEVWAPRAAAGELASDPGVVVHALPDHLGPRSLAVLGRELARRPDARIFAQYVPHGLGMRGMNLPFCFWLAARREATWVLFHEVAFPFGKKAPLRHNVLAAAQLLMASVTSRGADRLFITVPGWNDILRSALGREGEWLPVASNMPTDVNAETVARTRAALGLTPEQVVLGHFGTFARGITDLLVPTLRSLLAEDPRRVALLLGRGGKELAAGELTALGGRVIATGPLDAAHGSLDAHVLAAHLAASDLVFQPYPDGVSSRRTTAMAALALGKPVLTNHGILTEPLWHEGDVAIASRPSAEELAHLGEPLMASIERRQALAARGLALYERAFSLNRLVRALRS